MKPFNLEKAKAGEPLVTRSGKKARFIAYVPEAGTSAKVITFVEGEGHCQQSYENGMYVEDDEDAGDLFMAPLCQIEGKDVYPGDVLYRRLLASEGFVTASHLIDEYFIAFTDGDGNDYANNRDGALSWAKPVCLVTKEAWVNVYDTRGACAYPTEGEADDNADTASRKACIRIEWQEEA